MVGTSLRPAKPLGKLQMGLPASEMAVLMTHPKSSAWIRKGSSKGAHHGYRRSSRWCAHRISGTDPLGAVVDMLPVTMPGGAMKINGN